MDEEKVIINNTISIVEKKLNIILVTNNERNAYNKYLDTVLNIIKKPKYIPRSWIDEKDDLISRIETAKEELEDNLRNTVKADSFGDGMPRGQSNPDSEYQKHIRRLELEQTIIPNLEKKLKEITHKIHLLDLDFDNNIKDQVKELVELVPNERHKDILKQFYIYRKTYRQIAADTFISEETAKDYRKRGFKTLSDILYNFCQKTH